MTRFHLALAVIAFTALIPAAHAQQFAASATGTDLSTSALYSNPAAATGQPTTLDNDTFGDIYHASLANPAYGVDTGVGANLLTSLGSDGQGTLTVQFSTPIVHSDAHWYGQDFIVYTNSFFTGTNSQTGQQYVNEGDDLSQYILDGGLYGSLPTVSVSADGIHFVTVHTTDTLAFAENPYHWNGLSADNTSGFGALQDFSKPVNPALTAAAFTGISAADAIDRVYDGSAGGVSFSLAGTGLDSISYVRFTGSGNIDGVSAVSFATHAWTATAIATGQDGKTHILWNRGDGRVTVWTLNTDGTVSSYSSVFGPIAGWTAKALSIGQDNSARILWVNTDGRMTLWTLPASGSSPSYGPIYGPYTGWSAVGIATDTNNATHVLWDNASGAMTLWTLPVGGSPSYSPVFGPIAGWTATAVATDAGNAAHVLWDNTNGAMTLWTVAASGSASYGPVYGPFSGWSALGLSVDAGGANHVLWDNVNGSMTLWTLPIGGSPSYSPVFGPYAGWSAIGLSVSVDGGNHVLWDNANGMMTPWTLSASNQFVGSFPTYGPY